MSIVGQRFLQIAAATSPAVLKERLQSLGVVFLEGDFSARWLPEVQRLVMTTYPRNVGRLEGLLWLLDHGYGIAEPEDQHVGPANR